MEFFLVLFLLPIVVLAASIIGFLVTRKWFVYAISIHFTRCKF